MNKKSRVWLLSVLFTFLFLSSSYGQILISGVVKDKLGEPIPGVSIIEKSTTNGTSSDFRGKL